MWQHLISNNTHLHMLIITFERTFKNFSYSKLFLLKIAVEKEKCIGKEGRRKKGGKEKGDENMRCA